jgi:hypothetical protein
MKGLWECIAPGIHAAHIRGTDWIATRGTGGRWELSEFETGRLEGEFGSLRECRRNVP